MNILDENVPGSQRRRLQRRRVRVRQIGEDLGRRGMKDEEIIALLHGLNRPTFFTLDADFYDRRLCHEGYCLVHLDVDEESVAKYVVRLLRHRALNAKAKRTGRVIRVLPAEIILWQIHLKKQTTLKWE